MVGIISSGTYIPVWRITRQDISKATGFPSMSGSRSVASWDEDSLTMAVEAGRSCIVHRDTTQIDGIYFATVSSPFREKQAAAVIASALDLSKDIYTCDVTGSLRSGVLAVKAAYDAVKSGEARQVLVLAADARRARPCSDFEQTFGDGAAALLIGVENVIASIHGFSTVLNPIPGSWRREKDEYPNVFDSRFDSRFGYIQDTVECVKKLLSQLSLKPGEISRFAIYAPDVRNLAGVSKALNIDSQKQVQDIMFNEVGITGAAHCLLLLATALAGAGPHERILCSGYGDGAGAFLVETTERVAQAQPKLGKADRTLSLGYGQFLEFKREIDTGWPEKQKSSVIKYWRHENWALRLHGMKCRKCGTLRYPISKICSSCGENDNYDEVKLASQGKVFSYTHDYLLGAGNLPSNGITPTTRAVVDLEDGCRLLLEVADCEPGEVDINTPVRTTFRLLHEKSDYKFYGWKATPIVTSSK